ncbi:MAG: glycosyltransferase, partial [Actinomycetota bacterium]
HIVLFEAFARALAQLGKETTRLQLAGSGAEEDNLRAAARRLGIEEQVEFLGSVADVRALLKSCSFTVLPSLSEGTPNAVLESLACGKAVVASRVGGLPEILARGAGIMVPPGDPDPLAQAMIELLTDPARARQLGEQGRQIVQSRFGLQRMVDENLSLYLDLLSKKGIPLDTPSRLTVQETVSGERPSPPHTVSGA